MPRLGSMTVTLWLHHSQPIRAIKRAHLFGNFDGRQGPADRQLARAVRQFLQPARPFRAELLGQAFAQAPRQARRLPAGGGGQQQIAPAHNGRDMEIAERQHILDIDQHPQGPGAGGQVAGLALGQAGHEQQLQRRQGLVRDGFGQQARLNPRLGQQGRPAVARRPMAGQAGLQANGIKDKGKHRPSLVGERYAREALKCKN